jgi:hypothetical protein
MVSLRYLAGLVPSNPQVLAETHAADWDRFEMHGRSSVQLPDTAASSQSPRSPGRAPPRTEPASCRLGPNAGGDGHGSPPLNKTLIRLVLLVIVGAAAIAGVLVFKGQQKQSAGTRLLDEALADMGSIEVDDAGRAYLEGLARRFHDEAAKQAFESDGQLTGGTYDVNRYQRVLVDRMAAHARSDGSTHIAEKLEEFKQNAKLELGAP